MASKQEKTGSADIAALSVSTYCLFCGALALGAVYVFSGHLSAASKALMGAIFLGSLGVIQLLNRAARYFPAPLARPIHWTRAMALEGFAIACIIASHFTRLFWKFKKTSSLVKGRPILLVHGYFNDSTVWFYQKKQLESTGAGPVYAIDLGYPFLSIREYARRVGEKAKLIAEETGREDLVLVGYSMGGLVALWYALKIAVFGKVTDVVTIGAPLAGTPLARIGIGLNAREMQCDSDLLKTLQAEIQRHPEIRFYSIASKSDEISFPGGSTGLIGDMVERQFLIEDVGHAGLIYSPRVSEKICSWISSGIK